MNDNEIVLYDDGVHKCIMFSFDEEEQDNKFLSVNQFLLVQNDSAVLIDPGSMAIFEELYEAIEKYIDVNKIKHIFFSHQDPDVAGSISQWAVSTNANLIVSSLWSRFMVHYGVADIQRIISLPDRGAKIHFGLDSLIFIPAHFLHSPGNFSIYDSRSKILFSGDIGSGITPIDKIYKKVEDFDAHTHYLEGFHRRYMANNKIAKKWVEKVKEHEIDMIAPQHGAVFNKDDSVKFLNWFENLKCGSDIIDEIYD